MGMDQVEDDTPETRRIHFLTGVIDRGEFYECKKCGETTDTKEEMYEHKKNFISECDMNRLKLWLPGGNNE